MVGQDKIEVLMSVMYQGNFDIAYRTGIKSDLLIINQCERNGYSEIQVGNHTWRMICTTERGLSKSRNMALKNAMGDICLFCDDDEIMAEDYVTTIKAAFNVLPDATAVAFNLNRVNYKMKKTYYRITSIKISPKYRAYGSPMLAVRCSDIHNSNICFNEKFGSGTEWGGGEDSLFEYDIARCGLKIYEYPAEIATVDYSNESKWFHGYTHQYFYSLGGYIEYRYSSNVLLVFLRQVFTCYRLRRETELSLIEKLYWMRLGARGINKDVTYKEFLVGRKSN